MSTSACAKTVGDVLTFRRQAFDKCQQWWKPGLTDGDERRKRNEELEILSGVSTALRLRHAWLYLGNFFRLAYLIGTQHNRVSFQRLSECGTTYQLR